MFGKSKSLLLAALLAIQVIGTVPATAHALRQETASDDGQLLTYSLESTRIQVVAEWNVPNQKRKAIVLSIHGFGLNKCAYKALAERMRQYNVETYSIDVRGFGSWIGQGQKLDLNRSLEDIKLALIALREENPDTPIFLLGESMGGAVALRIAALHPDLVSGVIASVPSGNRYKNEKTMLKVAVRTFLGKGSRIPLAKQIISQVTSNRELANDLISDPEARLTVSTGELLELSRFMRGNHRNAQSIKDTAVLMVQGGQDRLVKPKGTIRLYEELSTRDKQLIVVKSAEHLIFEKGQFDESTIDQLNNWIERHSKTTVLLAANTQ